MNQIETSAQLRKKIRELKKEIKLKEQELEVAETSYTTIANLYRKQLEKEKERLVAASKTDQLLRDSFAANALAGIMGQSHEETNGWTPVSAAACAYSMADAMLCERTKRKK